MADQDNMKDESVPEIDETPEENLIQDEDFDGFDDHHDDDSGLARRALTMLGFLVAGAVLALWLGPKVAPHLPAGMAPVAEWLAPGGSQNQEEIAALREELLSEFENLPSNLTTTQIENIVAGRLANVEGRLVARLNELNSQFVVHDTTELESRLSELELKFEGLRAELASLTEQLSLVTVSGGEISADTAERIATYSAALEGLRAEIEALAAQNGELSGRLDSITRLAAEQVEDAQTKASEIETEAERERVALLVQSAFETIESALNSGTSVGPALERLSEAGVDIPAPLSVASGGVKTLPQLRNSFPDAAYDALRAALTTEETNGLSGAVSSFFRSQVMSRSLTPQEGDSVDAILSRAEAALRDDDLTSALAELSALPTMPDGGDGQVMAEWLQSAQIRQAAVMAFDQLKQSQGVSE